MTPFCRATGAHARFVVVASLLVAALAARAALAQHADPAFPVVDGRVYTSATYSNVLFVGGQFQRVGPNTGSFACVDFATGAALPYARIDGTVHTIASDSEGGWFVGGQFASVSGVPRANLARIRGDGSLDPWWNPGADGPVHALVPTGGQVFVGGAFLNAGGQPRRHVAALNRAFGEASAWDADADSVVFALALDSGTLWLGGRFAHVGGQPREKLAAVSAGTATPLAFSTTLGTWPGLWPYVSEIAVEGPTAYVAGQFTSIGGQPRTNLAALDAGSGLATGWDPAGAGPAFVNAIVPRGATVLLGGSFATIGGQARANLAEVSAATGLATAWNPGTDGAVRALKVAAGRLVAGGDFASAGGAPRANLAALELASGAATPWDPGAHGAVNAIAQGHWSPETTRVVVGGERMSMGAVARSNLALFDLSTGQVTEWNPGADGAVRSMSRAGTMLFVAGSFTHVGGLPRNGLAAFDFLTGWQPSWWAPGAANGPIESLHAHGNTAYIGGGFTTVNGIDRAHLAALDIWTGAVTDWNPGADNWVKAVAARDGRVFVGGMFSTLAGASHANLGAVDSATAAPLVWQPDADNVVDCVVPDDEGRVYVGGWFTTLAGVPRLRIGRVSAATGAPFTWDPGADAPVEAIVPVGPLVYAGGLFQTMGGTPARGVAAIDATSGVALPWNPDLSYMPWTLAVRDGVVYAGGDLFSAGMLPLRGLAKLFPPDTGPPAPQVLTPNGGEYLWEDGQPYLVTWTIAEDQRVPWVDLEYALGSLGGPWAPIATALPNTGSYEWVQSLFLAGPAGSAHVVPPAWLRVVARDLAGNTGSDASDNPFTLPGTGEVDPQRTTLSLSVSPSPVRGAGRVLLSLPVPAMVRIGLFDIAGREVARLADASYGAGPQAFALPQALAPGVYVVLASVGETRLTRKFVLLD